MPISVAAEAAWARVGELPPSSLVDARLQLHHAVQIAVSASISYLPARPDDSHTALSWSAPIHALITEPIAADRPVRFGVRLRDLTLLALDGAMSVTRTLALSERTVGEATAWLGHVASEAGLDPARLTTRKHYTIPDHPVASGAPFSIGSGDPFRELKRYWSNAALVLDELARTTAGASPVRCWPHHFDIATLIAPPASAGERRSTIGVGHSPGDEWYAEPYWYVGPSPYPEPRDLPSLDGRGRWHTKGWVGAVLPASDYVAGDAEAQHSQVSACIDSAVVASRRLLRA